MQSKKHVFLFDHHHLILHFVLSFYFYFYPCCLLAVCDRENTKMHQYNLTLNNSLWPDDAKVPNWSPLRGEALDVGNM